MADPLVTVVIPVYRGLRFLVDAVRSVAAQSHPAIETIVVDDGSPDGSAELAASLDGVRLLHRPHLGVAAARNAGASAARGELLAFLDQDDEWVPEKLARQIAALEQHPEADLILCQIETVLVPGTPAPDWLQPAWLKEPRQGFIPSTWLMRRRAFERVGPFDVRFQIGCDGDWLARYKDGGGRHVMLDEPLVRWRIHDANGSYGQDVMHQEVLTILRGTVRRQRSRARSGGEKGREVADDGR